MSRQPKSKRLAINDGNKADAKSKAPQNAKMIPVTKSMDVASYTVPAQQASARGIMIPEAPWKAMPNLTQFPNDAATGTVYTAEQAMKGNDPAKYRDPLVDHAPQPEIGGFIDPGLLMRETKAFNSVYPDPKKDNDYSAGEDMGVGGFPTNPQAPGMTTPLFNVGRQPVFPQRFSAEEARSTAVAGASGGAELPGGKKSSSGSKPITRG